MPNALPEVVPCMGPGVPPPCVCPQPNDGINVYVPVEEQDGTWDCRLVNVDPGPGQVPVAIPTLSEVGMIALAVVLALVGLKRVP